MAKYIARAPAFVREIEGFLSDREMRFLALMGGVRLAEGQVLEIGSYQGKSTAILAGAARLAGDSHITAVDPLHEPHLIDNAARRGFTCLREALDHNLTQRGVHEMVDFRQQFSAEVATTWERPLRLLWIDGDHSFPATSADFDGFSPHLADGGVVAFHDTLNHFEGSLRVFLERVLLDHHFGPSGVVGSIGWSRRFADPQQAMPYAAEKLRLYRRLAPLVPMVALGNKPQGLAGKWFKLNRARVPRRELSPEQWLRKVA